jgi:catechol 2,3-dioxygenase-like lactoylglutathione lyase family enzyme
MSSSALNTKLGTKLNTQVGIEGIQAITYSTQTQEQWELAQKFYADWGLTNPLISADVQQWSTQNNSLVKVVRGDNANYPTPIEGGSTLRAVEWGVHSVQCLQTIAQQLKDAPGFKDCRTNGGQQGHIEALDPHGLLITFALNKKTQVDLNGGQSNPWGHNHRINSPSPIYEKAQPIEIGHVVLFTNALEQAESFYQRIGFVTSDQYPGRGIFMRCSAQGGHHDLFLLQVPGKAQGLNHVAFTVRDIHEVFGGGLHMDRKGWKTQLGPGRHPISSAYFWYFENPCGGLIEYNADEDRLTQDWQPRIFEPGPTVFAEWAVDGGLDGTSRRQKAGPAVASGKFLTEKKT